MNAIQFIKEIGVDKAREVVEGAPDGCTHYRLLSCGAKYTKHVSISECYIWNGIMWRACSTPYLVFTSDVIHSISDLKRLVESLTLIEAYGGINACRDAIYMLHELTEDPEPIKQAIADYELIGGEHV